MRVPGFAEKAPAEVRLTVRDRKHLAAIMRSIRRLKPVMRITRNQG